MNPPSDIGPRAHGETSRTDTQPIPPGNWHEALASLISARLGIIQLEAADVTKAVVKRVILFAIAGGCALFAWILLLAGGISLLADATGWAWNLVAIGGGILHLLIGLILIKSAKSASQSPFPVTRAEFQKDCSWIKTFQKTSRSND